MVQSPGASGAGSTGGAAEAGRLSDRIAAGVPGGLSEAFGRPTQVKVVALAALVLVLHYKLIEVLVRTWIHDANWTHGFIIPLFSLYLLYVRREEIYQTPRKTSYVGLPLMLLALGGQIVAVFWIRNYWLAEIGMVGVIFGLVLYLAGWRMLRLTWLPILFLLFALPIPEILYSRIAVPLQNLSASGSVVILKLLGVKIRSDASQLSMMSVGGVERQLTVAEACAGMRLLMAFLALGVAMAYLEYRPVWERVVLVVAAVPIAVLCNIVRVAITSWMYYIDRPAFGQKFMHTFTGLLMLVPALVLLWALGWILRHLFVEEPEPSAPGRKGASA